MGGMKHLTFADKDFLVGDALADAVLEYAAVLGETRSADSIDIRAIGADGDEIEATFFLSAGVPLVAETTRSSLPEPDNAETVAYIEARLAQHVAPATAQPLDDDEEGGRAGRSTDLDGWLDTQE